MKYKTMILVAAAILVMPVAAYAERPDAAYGSPYASPGMRYEEAVPLNGNQIRVLQQALNDEGYYKGAMDGVWSPTTVSALRQFQLDNGLESTGILTPTTMNTLGVQFSANEASRIRQSGGLLANAPVGSVGIRN